MMERVKKAYNSFAPHYDNLMERPYQIFYRERVKRILDKYIPKNSKVLDIGCGTGFPSIYLAQKRNCTVTGIDVSTKMITKAVENLPKEVENKVSYKVLSATKLHYFKDEEFDCIVSIYGSLNYVKRIEPVLKEIKRVIRKDGIFLSTFYSKYSYIRLQNKKHLEALKNNSKIYPHYIGDKKLEVRLYDTNELSSLIKKYFYLISMEGISFIPFFFFLENSKELIDNLYYYLNLEESLAKTQPFINLGMDILTIGKKR
ncbi:MAG: class I SAM-dependent methyltransferase [Candidatus Aenigmatarchaeota archaeon]